MANFPLCKDCKHYHCPINESPCEQCHEAFMQNWEKPSFVSAYSTSHTHFDSITQTPEKLAEFISKHTACPITIFNNFPECTIDDECIPRKCWLKWLRQEEAK